MTAPTRRVQVPPTRVFASYSTGVSYGVMAGTLVNEVKTVLWRCQHRHRSSDVAVRCAEDERRRWIRAGKGSA